MEQQKKFAIASLLLFFFLLQLAVGFLVIDGSSLSFDESIWHYIGRNWFRHGLTPYAGGVDNKSPFMFAIYGFSDFLFGINYWFPRVLGAIAQTIGIFFLFKLVEKITGYKAALIAATIYGFSLTWRATGGKYIAYTESYEICLVISAFYYFFRDEEKKSFFISGCFAGLAIFFRLTGAFGALALLATSFRKSKSSCLLFLSGLFFMSAISLAIFALAGISLSDFFIFSFRDNFGEGSISGHTLSWKFENLADGLFLSYLVIFLPGIIGYILIKKRIDVFVLWLILEFIGLNLIGLYARQHFRDLLPPMAIMSAISIYFLMDKYHLKLRSVLIITWIAFFPKQIEPLYALKDFMRPGTPSIKPFCQDTELKVYDEDKRALGEWISRNTKEKDKVFIAGMSAVVQVYANRLSPTIYFNSTETARAKKRIMEDLALHKPDIILIPKFKDYLRVDSTVRNSIDSIVAKDYRYETCQYNFGVYRLKKAVSY